jgi:hypothetical protein
MQSNGLAMREFNREVKPEGRDFFEEVECFKVKQQLLKRSMRFRRRMRFQCCSQQRFVHNVTDGHAKVQMISNVDFRTTSLASTSLESSQVGDHFKEDNSNRQSPNRVSFGPASTFTIKHCAKILPTNIGLKSSNTKLILLSAIFVAVQLTANRNVAASSAQSFSTTANTYSEPQAAPDAYHHQHHHQHQQTDQIESSSQIQTSTTTTSSSTANAACFGGLQTFEKISMSSFENPAGSGPGANAGGSLGSGILVQQDDQALTSECINLCRSQSNCLSFVIDYNKFECKSYATTQLELQQEFANRFQSARATANGNSSSSTSGGPTSETNSDQLNGYQASASSSSLNFQQLLPSASSNYFEKICLDGVANRNQFSDVCGQGRLWTIERVVDSFLDGFVEKEVTNVNGKDECSKLCIFETQFVCRSADYDQHSRLCRLSKEDRRTQPQAMRYVANSNRQYLENQCTTPGPSSCVYETKRNVGIISMDALKFAQTAQDCQMKCNQESTFNCRSYSFHQQRCFLSGDDSVSLNSNLIKLPQKQGWMFGEKKCLVELCTKGIFSYERITGYTLRSALATSIDLMAPASSMIKSMRASPTMGENQAADSLQPDASQTRVRRLMPPTSSITNHNVAVANGSSLASAMMMMMMDQTTLAADAESTAATSDPLQEAATSSRHTRTVAATNNLAITEHCRHSCDLGYLNCPAFTVDYKNNRCQRLDRNSQGRHNDLVARDGFAYYEKICLRVPEIMSMCQDKYWIFERVIGYELAPRLYDKSLKFVQSRRDCEEYCLEEKQFQCRSALYNDETFDCKLSRYDRRLALQEGGYYRNFNVRMSYLENNCIRDRQLEKKHCYFEQVKDEPAYPTFTERIEVATLSSNPSEHQDYSAASQPMRSNQSQTNSSSHHRYGSSFCEQLCNDNAKFECHSFGYYASTAQCFLSGDDSVSAGEMATTPSTGFAYYEKKCRLNMNDSNVETTDEGPHYPGGATTAPTTSGVPATGGGGGGLGPGMNPYFQPTIQTSMRPTTPSHRPIDDGYGNLGPQTRPIPSTSNGTQGYQDSSGGAGLHPSTFVPMDGMRPQTMDAAGGGAGGAPPATGPEATSPDMYKCGAGHSFVYQRISGFEPIGGYLTLLMKNNEQPGIVAECSELCRRAFECRAFVVDYNNNQCFAMLENSSVGLLNLRQTLGKDYFEGFCLADHLLQTSVNSNCRNRTWVVDKIVDQAVFGVQHQKLIANSDRIQCRRACLEERLFVCKSAMYDSSTADCKLYSIDRESIPQMRLIFTKGVDFFENQCQIMSNSCPYDAIERDMTIITITKSVQARSTFDCELACNSETSFNCRSYTYLDQYPSLPNLCLLSSDSRSTSQRGSVREHQRTLYAERNCYFRRPRFPGGAGLAAGHHKYDLQSPTNALPGGGFTPGPPVNPLLVDPYRSSMNPAAPMPSRMPTHDTGGDHISPPLPPDLPMPPKTINTEQEGLNAPNAYDILGPPIAGQLCEPHQFTFERTFGYDFKLAPKERAPIAPTIGIAVGCQQECLRRGDKCQSFVVDYTLPYQSCFLIETQAGANKRLLVRSTNSAYFEKVCLPRTGIAVADSEPLYSHAPMTMMPASPPHQYSSPASANPQMDPLQSLDISPSYSQEPWSVQGPPSPSSPPPANQLPYHLQQQNLIQNYPSRACAKLWAFERFINHNFTAPIDKLVENSLTRAHCETQCLNEASFNCRAATYDYTNKICRLFKSTRRTMLSHFIDLESTSTDPTSGPPSQASATTPVVLAHSHPGTAHVLDPTETMQSSASSIANNDQNRRQGGARQLAQQATAEPSNQAKNIDYLENTCTTEPSSCQYRQIYDQFSPYIDKVNHASSLNDCQRQCDQERLFSCKSINFDASSKNCMLINEDLISLARGQQTNSSPLLPKRNTIYSEKGNCEMISVQCNSQEMLVSINFDSPFRGRIMAKGNPEQCYMLGDGQTSLQFSIVFGPKCNSRQEGHNTFVNEVVIQQHPIIMTESDKTVRVMCAFEAPDQTITFKNPSSRDNKTVGIDVSTPDSGRTRQDKQQFNSVVSNKAPPPSVMLRILDQNGRDASMINLGDDLMLKIQMQMVDGKNSALGIFARNLAARSSNGESLLLIDNEGCPVDPLVFPALEIDQKDGRSLYSNFKAFRFPSSGLVNFEVQIRFCPERCHPVDCNKTGQRLRSYGRKRRKRQIDVNNESNNHGLGSESAGEATSKGRAAILQSLGDQSYPLAQQPIAALDSLSTVMKPGKAFEYVRKLMLPQQPEPSSVQAANGVTSSEEPYEKPMPQSQPGVERDPAGDQEASNQTGGPQSSAPDVQADTNRNNEDFDNHTPKTSDSQPDVSADPGSAGQELVNANNQFSQPDVNQAHASVHFSPVSAPIELPAGQQKSTQMLGDQIEPNMSAGHGYSRQYLKPIHAPYGNYKTPSIKTQQQAATELSVDDSRTGNGEPRLDPGQQQFRQESEHRKDLTSSVNDEILSAAGLQSSSNVGQLAGELPKQQTLASSKDMPLRFSILVAENQLPPADGQLENDQPPTIMNSTSMDMDHIVIPGKKGQLDEAGLSANSLAATSSINVYGDSHSSHYSEPNSVVTGKGRLREPNKRNASYEQTFDALPSNSVTSEIQINQNIPHELTGDQNLQAKTRQHVAQPPPEISSESVANHDCQLESSGRSRLHAIIWTGGIVIGLNVCLVVLSLVLYFRKVHSRQNHTIVRSPSDCGTARSDGIAGHGGTGSRFGGSTSHWPSVILKSKNKLGTSLKTHEQFFCKLNSKPSGVDSRLEHEFNWPNLSSSSSRSTLSSLASPMPSTSIRINQMRPSIKSSPFDAQSSLRNGNFIPDHETHKGIDESSDIDGEYPARYTSNIDVLRSDRF